MMQPVRAEVVETLNRVQVEGVSLVKKLMKKAEEGDALANYVVSRLYKDAKFLPHSMRKYFHYLERSASAGFPMALGQLSYDCLVEGSQIYDEKRGLELAKTATEAGDLLGKTVYAFQLLQGDKCERDPELAFKLLSECERNGDIMTPQRYFLAQCYANGWGTPIDLDKAVALIRSIDFTPNEGLYHSFLEENLSEVAQEHKESMHEQRQMYLDDMIDKARKGDSIHQLYLAGAYLQGSFMDEPFEYNLEKGLECLRKSALGGNNDACNYLVEYFTTKCNPADNSEEIEKWNKLAAERGDETAMVFRGNMFGSQGKYDEAGEWLRKAAEAGGAMGKAFFGHYCLFFSEENDDACRKGALLIKEAAEAGYPLAMKWHGNNLLHGNGVEVDIDEAGFYLSQAAYHGDNEAKTLLASIYMGVFDADFTDTELAEEILAPIADDGDPVAAYFLGLIYFHHYKEYEMAFEALSYAASLGSEEARKFLEENAHPQAVDGYADSDDDYEDADF